MTRLHKTWVWTSPIDAIETMSANERSLAIERAELYAASIFRTSENIVVTDIRSSIIPDPNSPSWYVIKTILKGYSR
jgi:hypothetical protein